MGCYAVSLDSFRRLERFYSLRLKSQAVQEW